MAGGVAHRMNQPLTIINNLIDEVLFDLKTDDKMRTKIVSINQQIKKLNDITKKIGNIKKYKAMEYVAGIKIVEHYHKERSHQGLDNEIIEPPPPGTGEIICQERLGGLLKFYRRAA